MQTYTRFGDSGTVPLKRLPSGASASASGASDSTLALVRFLRCMVPRVSHDESGYLSSRVRVNPPLFHTTPYNSHSPLTIIMKKPMSVVEHADRLMQEAGDLFRDKKSTMRGDYRDLAEDQMTW